ncbi:SMI1/KNR4 family protein [Streptomyces sp. NPDC002574]|uniref:SMI1/KNR4 family protein n=1 Tax=Streptomyces sp. NPDC002574 TaxID=3364652 RepID=UPI00368685F9
MSEYADRDQGLLIEKLRSRAWDPARRFDEVPVPIAWIEQHYGEDRVEAARESSYAFSSDGTIDFPAGSPEADHYYRSDLRRPLFPPADVREVEKAEREIGHRLPQLLRRLYTEVGNGGFGPYARGFSSITSSLTSPDGLVVLSLVETYQRDCARGMPASWLELTPCGCAVYWYVSLTEPGNPVMLYETDRGDPRYGQRPEEGVHGTIPLREWLWIWADGGDVWDEVLEQRK